MPKKTDFDHIIWAGKGAGGHYDRERRELGLDRDVTLKAGVPVAIGDKPGQVPEDFAKRLVEAGKAVYCSDTGKTVQTDDPAVRVAVKEAVAAKEDIPLPESSPVSPPVSPPASTPAPVAEETAAEG